MLEHVYYKKKAYLYHMLLTFQFSLFLMMSLYLPQLLIKAKQRIDLQIFYPVSCFVIMIYLVEDIINLLVDDFCRVKLTMIEGVEGSDYINASYIDV